MSFSPSANILNPSVQSSTDGTYTVKLETTDSYSSVHTRCTFTLTWDTTDPYFTTAMTDEGSTIGAPFSKTAHPADDTSGIASGVWELVSSTVCGNVVFSNPNDPTTTLTPTISPATYVVKYTVTDQAGHSASDDFSFDWDTAILTASISGLDNRYTGSLITISGSGNGDSVSWSASDAKVNFSASTANSTDVWVWMVHTQ